MILVHEGRYNMETLCVCRMCAGDLAVHFVGARYMFENGPHFHLDCVAIFRGQVAVSKKK